MNKMIMSLICICCGFSFSAHSALISHSGYTLDTDTRIVSGGGLEWLQWSNFSASTLSQALQSYSDDGWRLANRTEILPLLDTFSPVSISAALENSETFSYALPNSVGSDNNPDRLIELMGDIAGGTLGQIFGFNPDGSTFDLGADDLISYTTAIFVDSEVDGTIQYGHAEVYSDGARRGPTSDTLFPGVIRVDTNFTTTPSLDVIGALDGLDTLLSDREGASIALVRDIQQVPELSASLAPVSVLLLGCLLCLGVERRKKQRWVQKV